MINAVVFVRPDNYRVNAARCLEYCDARRYNVVGLVQGDWRAAVRMLGDGLASVIVVTSPDQPEAASEPHVEVVPRRPSRRGANTSRRWAAAVSPRSRTRR